LRFFWDEADSHNNYMALSSCAAHWYRFTLVRISPFTRNHESHCRRRRTGTGSAELV